MYLHNYFIITILTKTLETIDDDSISYGLLKLTCMLKNPL